MQTLTIPAGHWRKKAARVMEQAMQEAKPIVYTVHGRPRFALVTIRVRMGLPLQHNLMGQMRALWTGLTKLPTTKGQPYTMGADDLRRDTSSTLRGIPLEPGWFSRRGDIIAALVPAPLGGDLPLTFDELLEEFWTLVVGWQSRQGGRTTQGIYSEYPAEDHSRVMLDHFTVDRDIGPDTTPDRRPQPFDTGE